MPGRSSIIIFAGICIIMFLTAGCTDSSQSTIDTPAKVTMRTTVPTPTPVKEIVYVYVTVTVTPAPPTPVPTPTKDKVALSYLPAYNAWRYQTVLKDDGTFRHGPVAALLLHLDKAPDEKSYRLYYNSERVWKEDLERLIDDVKTTAPTVRSAGMSNAISNYTVNLTLQNETIQCLDRVLTNWEFADAGRVTNGIVLNITNATQTMDKQVSSLF